MLFCWTFYVEKIMHLIIRGSIIIINLTKYVHYIINVLFKLSVWTSNMITVLNSYYMLAFLLYLPFLHRFWSNYFKVVNPQTRRSPVSILMITWLTVFLLASVMNDNWVPDFFSIHNINHFWVEGLPLRYAVLH